MKKDYKIRLQCPWCKSGEVFADQHAKLQVSFMCNKCRNTNFYKANLYTGRTYRIKPRDTRDFPYRLRCPCCNKGEIAFDGMAEVNLSVICSKCNSAFIADLHTRQAYPSKKIRRVGR